MSDGRLIPAAIITVVICGILIYVGFSTDDLGRRRRATAARQRAFCRRCCKPRHATTQTNRHYRSLPAISRPRVDGAPPAGLRRSLCVGALPFGQHDSQVPPSIQMIGAPHGDRKRLGPCA
jgi:hypothetical protein